MNQLSRNLTHLMNARGTNPTAVSKDTGVPQPTIHRILRGTSEDPRTSTLEPLADYFNVTVEELRSADLTQGQALATGSTPLLLKEHREIMGSVAIPGALNEIRGAVSLKGGASAPVSLSHRAQMQRRLLEMLPEELKKYVRATTTIQGFRYGFDYCSDKVAADIGIFNVRKGLIDGRPIGISSFGVVQSLWRLSTLRLLTLETHPERGYYLFLSVLNETDEPTPMGPVTRTMGEGALHHIHVVWSNVESAAHFIEGIEDGSFKHSSFSDSDLDEEEE
ncbi:helix-turn-helix transcriptional regulator [Ralstonia syzygii subsp. celebesensis]|uniref:HTH cro/C1-type domain-containing protein n=2 Tax=Ralstonia syzygii subsp. celebesensis TaxID=1310168 RepID=A0A1U9VEK3_9RALS|nr:helix-turn-helix transcriptional regulator [Ralstonia syzygii]AQW29109.1 hypothetical protein B0B51_03165 [blood disease bacterium A2-HR MARDI]QQV54348.1 helix-turn-helix transcriptional regulator [Ralstonia syzygii subsp. celebesensis]CCA79399.1 hypothetical protein BDB_60006 [blood disease bacterium R229]